MTINKINNVDERRDSIMAKETMRYSNDDRSIGTTHSAGTIKRNNGTQIMPTLIGA